jgi:hypothetical protein
MDIKLLSEDIWSAFMDNKHSGIELESMRKNSEIFSRIDMMDYLFNESDKLPMNLFDGSRTINDDYEYTFDCLKQRIESIKQLSIALLTQCEHELKFIDKVHETTNY